MSTTDRLEQLKRRYGLQNVKGDWLRQSNGYSLENLADQIARRDLCEICDGTLSFDVSQAHAITLQEPTLVQVEDVMNLSSDDPRGKGLQHTSLLARLTDGRQSITGMELLPLGGRLSVRTVPGTKLRLSEGTLIRRGRVLLTPATVQVIGRIGPSGNVWGAQYEAKIAQSMKDAGFKAEGSSTFDSIREQADANSRITGLGGIANVGEDEDENSDDEFWISAMAATEDRVPGPSANGGAPGGGREFPTAGGGRGIGSRGSGGGGGSARGGGTGGGGGGGGGSAGGSAGGSEWVGGSACSGLTGGGGGGGGGGGFSATRMGFRGAARDAGTAADADVEMKDPNLDVTEVEMTHGQLDRQLSSGVFSACEDPVEAACGTGWRLELPTSRSRALVRISDVLDRSKPKSYLVHGFVEGKAKLPADSFDLKVRLHDGMSSAMHFLVRGSFGHFASNEEDEDTVNAKSDVEKRRWRSQYRLQARKSVGFFQLRRTMAGNVVIHDIYDDRDPPDGMHALVDAHSAYVRQRLDAFIASQRR